MSIQYNENYVQYYLVQWQLSRAVAVLGLCAAMHLDSLHTKFSSFIIFVVCQTHKNILTQKFLA